MLAAAPKAVGLRAVKSAPGPHLFARLIEPLGLDKLVQDRHHRALLAPAAPDRQQLRCITAALGQAHLHELSSGKCTWHMAEVTPKPRLHVPRDIIRLIFLDLARWT